MEEKKIESVQKQVAPQKKKMSRKKLALIGAGTLAIATVAIVPPLCVTQCNHEWNEYFVEPSKEILSKKINRLGEWHEYELELKEEIPLYSQLEVRIVNLERSNGVILDIKSESVSYLKKKLKFNLNMDISINEINDEIEKHWANFDLEVKCMPITQNDDPKTPIWTTILEGFNIYIEKEKPLETKIVVPSFIKQLELVTDEDDTASDIIGGFRANINPSFISVTLEYVTKDHYGSYSASIIQKSDTDFDVMVSGIGIGDYTEENIEFNLVFRDITKTTGVITTVPELKLHAKYGNWVKLNEDAPTEFDIELDETETFRKNIKFGTFRTNTISRGLNVTATYSGLDSVKVTEPLIVLDSKNPQQFSISIDFYKISHESAQKNVELTLKFENDFLEGWSSREFKFNIKISYDMWCGRVANFTDASKKLHWITSFEERTATKTQNSNICNSKGEGDIYADDGASWPRNEFNFELNFSPKIEMIPSFFLRNCTGYNQEIHLSEGIKIINDGFMQDCTSFNGEIDFGTIEPQLEEIRGDFLTGCTSFNNGSDGTQSKPLVLPKSLIRIYSNFLVNNNSFNQEIKFNENLATIGGNFLTKCQSFNQLLVLPDKLEAIGNNFMSGCSSFNQELFLPNNIHGIGEAFMKGTNSMKKVINLQSLNPAIFADSDETLSSTVSIEDGPLIEGIYKKEFCDKFKDITRSGLYRKLTARPFYVKYNGISHIDADAGTNASNLIISSLDTNIDFANNNFTFSIAGVVCEDTDIRVIRKIEIRSKPTVALEFSGIHEDNNGTPCTVKIDFWDKRYPNEKVQVGFHFLLYFNLWKRNQAYAIDGNRIIWMQTLLGSGLCCASPDDTTTPIQGIYEDGTKYYCHRDQFNLPLVLNPNTSEIKNNFLCGCTNFNKPITLSQNLEIIGEYFMYKCEAFNQMLVLPNTLTSFKCNYMLWNAKNMQNVIDIQDLSLEVFEITPESKQWVLSTDDNTSLMYSQGIKIKGYTDYLAKKFLYAFPNLDDNPYRNLRIYIG